MTKCSKLELARAKESKLAWLGLAEKQTQITSQAWLGLNNKFDIPAELSLQGSWISKLGSAWAQT